MSTQIAKPALVRLKNMIGKTFMYKGNQITIKDYHVLGEEGKTQIDIEEGEAIKTADLAKFIDFCLPVQTPEEDEADQQTDAVSTEVVAQTQNILSTLHTTLLDNIKKVQQNEKYIKQANVINSSVNSLIGLAKLQIQVGKMTKGK
jgi:hypothetical protein